MSKVIFHVGTSGYSYPAWKGSFYPQKLPATKMLEYYSRQFDSVEYNGSFRAMPKPASLEKSKNSVPADFKFVIKAPQLITHLKRLKEAKEPVGQFLEAVDALENQFGAILFQLPPNLKKDAPRLEAFLSLIPKSYRATFEFRHESWFDEETFDLLRAKNAALCLAEAEEGVETPFVSTADWGYLRLRLPAYSDADLKGWIDRVKKQKWKETFVFFKHEDEGRGPKMAVRFMELAGMKRELPKEDGLFG